MVKFANELLNNKDDFLFKIDVLDNKTEKLFSIIRNTVRVIEYQKCIEEIHSIFFSLVHFTDHHLKDLEIVLKDLKCKNLAEQVNHNKKFTENIIKFQADYKEGKENLCKNLLGFIISWVKEQKEIDKLSLKTIEKSRKF